MSIEYEAAYRPNFERQLAFIWATGGMTSFLAMTAVTGLPILPSAALSSVFFAAAGYQATFAVKHRRRFEALQRRHRNFYEMDELVEEMQGEALFLGRGFAWTGNMAQKVSDILRDPDLVKSLRGNRDGATYLHGVGYDEEAPIYLRDDESKGHVHIVGTTGAGKTRLMDLLVAQAIMRDEAVIIIDPKGDRELRLNAEAAYRRAGRAKDFVFFHPAFVDESAAINPLSTFQRESELASRLAAVVPTSTSGDVFQSFSQNALMGIFFAVLISGTTPTIMDVQRALSEGVAPLTINALEGWARRVSPEMQRKLREAMDGAKSRSANVTEKMAVAGAQFYHQVTATDHSIEIAEMNNLISLLLHDKDHFKKMVASLVPVIGQLCSGPLQTLFSPDPSAGRMPKSGQVISLRSAIKRRQGVYIGLDTLSDALVGRAMGQLILADLASLAGQRYNRGHDGRFVNIFIDEASEVTNEQLIQLLNKGRGAGFRLFVATQTLADYAARTGSADVASMLVGNMNTTIMLRTVDPDTQEKMSVRMPEVPIHYVMRTASSGLSDAATTGAFSVSHGERLMHEDKPLVAPQMFGDLSDLEFFAITPRGDVLKGLLPILISPDQPPETPGSTHYADLHLDPDSEEEPETAQYREPAEPPPVIPPATPTRRAHLLREFVPQRIIDVLPGLRDDQDAEKRGWSVHWQSRP